MKTYQSFGALARALNRAAAQMPLSYAAAMKAGAEAVATDAKSRIGHYQDGWKRLAPSTVAEKTRLGFAGVPLQGGDGGDNPLLRTGALRESIETEATAHMLVVGSASDILKYQEWGTRTLPPRPVLLPALHHTMPAVTALIGKAVTRTLEGA